MTAATVTSRFDYPMAREKVVLTVSDGYIFTSKLTSPQLCQITEAEDMGSETNSASYSISGQTITIYADGVSAKKMAVTVYGKL